MRTLLIITLVFTSALYKVSAQIENDTLIATQYYKKAETLLNSRDYKASINYFEKALFIYKKAQSWEKVISCYNNIAVNQRRTRLYDESVKNLQTALKLNRLHLKPNNILQSKTLAHLGLYYDINGEYDKAFHYFSKALQIREELLPENHILLAQIYKSIGIVYAETDQIENALHYFNKDLAIKKLNLGENDPELAASYINLSVLYNQLREFESSLNYCKEALEILELSEEEDKNALTYIYNSISMTYEDLGRYEEALDFHRLRLKLYLSISKSHPNIAYVYESIGGIYTKREDYEKALAYIKKADSILSKRLKKDSEGMASIKRSLGLVYLGMESYNKALLNFEQSNAIYTKIYREGHSSLASGHSAIADVYLEQKKYQLAEEYYLKSLKSYARIFGNKHPYVAILYNKLGILYLNQGQDYKKALEYYENALMANSKRSKKHSFNDVIKPEDFIDHLVSFSSLLGKGRVMQKSYEGNNDLNTIKNCISTYDQAQELIDYKRLTLNGYEDKIQFSEKAQLLYKDGMDAHYKLFKKSKTIENRNRLFAYLEKSKSNTLKELLLCNPSELSSNLLDTLIIEEQKTRKRRLYYKSKILIANSEKKKDSFKINKWEVMLFKLNRKQDSINKVLKEKHPKYHHLTYENTVISIKEIQQKLTNNQTLIEFFVADSTTYAFTISKNQYDVKELQTPKLEEQTAVFRKAITDQDHQQYKKLGLDLYKLLIEPIKDQLVGDELIIVPDESLWHLNFDVLLTKPSDASEPSKFPYLLKDYAISYANSATLLFDPFEQKTTDAKQEGCLAFSFSDSTQTVENNNMSLATLRAAGDDLPGTRKEIKAISEIVDGQYFFGNNADEANFKKHASNYKILHLALHGEVDNERPENSKLYFTKSKDTIEDNYLYSHELFALNIPAELTVLSACNTGTGKIAKGEGIMSLGNAFQYAGTKSLLLSSWEVPDVTTPQLMQNFYTNLKDGMNKSKALQQAKLQYMNQADIYKAAPFYWGGFYLVGDPTPIDLGESNWWIWTLVIGGLLLLALFFLKQKHKNI
ncbi:CHAT domain-containing protein [Aquimarina sp. SS2-1]|uniref:CHAT domain-containing protein n=1 Tax=Aquimarina besae TaxID=3342247 RepID=UPI0036716E1B